MSHHLLKCQLKVFCQNEDGSRTAIPLRNQRALDDLQSRAITRKKKPVSLFKVGNNVREALKDGNRGFVKRLREANDEERAQLLLTELSRTQEVKHKKQNLNSTPKSALNE